MISREFCFIDFLKKILRVFVLEAFFFLRCVWLAGVYLTTVFKHMNWSSMAFVYII